MSTDISAALSVPPAARSPARQRARQNTSSESGSYAKHAIMLAVSVLLVLAWYVRERQPYTSSSEIGYWMGVAGGSLMALLLLYPLRKRMRWTQVFGPLRHWFRLHMVAGIGGPLLVLYHSTFHVGSFNAAIALGSMLLVTGSGIVGRFLYRRIHHGLYGREATLNDLQEALGKHLESLGNELATLPAVREIIDGYLKQVMKPSGKGKADAIWHFITLGYYRRAALRRINRLIPRQAATRKSIADTLYGAQNAAQFNAYVRLFALWHVVHIPFLGMLVLTAIAHVIAVHTY